MKNKPAALAVDPDFSGRNWIKQAARASGVLGAVRDAQSAKEARLALQGSDNPQIVFLSHRLAEEALSSLARRAKQKKAAVVFVQSGSSNTAQTVMSILSGADAILTEPFSTGDLIEVVQTAFYARMRTPVEQKRSSIAVAVAFSMKQIDHIAAAQLSGDSLPALKQLVAVGRMTKELVGDSLELYFSGLRRAFTKAPLPKTELAVQPYGGVSQRVQAIVDHRDKGEDGSGEEG